MPNSSRILDKVANQTNTQDFTEFKSTIIPKSFWLGGLKINVQVDETLKHDRMIGRADYLTQELRIDPNVAPQQFVEQSYLHELVHWIFYMMNEHELRDNERIVDLFAHFLYQALTTAEYQVDSDIDNVLPFDV